MPAYRGPIVDVDVHHRPSDASELRAYLPEEWRDYLPVDPPGPGQALLSDHAGKRADAYGEDGGHPGGDYEILRSLLLDRHPYYRCVLTFDTGPYPSLANHYFMRAVCRAANDWNLDTWLARGDERLFSTILVPTALPDEAAAEIRRLAEHPLLVGVLLAANPFGRPYGDPLYHPIFEAAAEVGLPIMIHPSAADRPNESTVVAAGTPSSGMAIGSQFTQQAHHYISSLIVHGVFEKYPQTRVLVKEYGVAWLPWLMWRLDQEYERLREESPWVKRWPSEYIREHIKLSTQPIEEGLRSDDLIEHLQMVEGVEDLLCFSSDYPHGTMDDPAYVARVLPQSWHRKVFVENACRSYGWEAPAETWAQQVRAA